MIEAKVTGIPDFKRQLAQIVPKLRVKALRQALAAGGRVVRDAARRATPVLSASSPAVRRGVRKPGTVRKALTVRTSKIARRQGDVGVFVNVRPARGGKRGAKNPNDPYYWAWLNFGRKASLRAIKLKFRSRRQGTTRRSQTGAYAGARFLEAGAAQLGRALQVFLARMPAIFSKLNQRQTP